MLGPSLLISRWNELGYGVADHVRKDGQLVEVAIPGTIVGEKIQSESLVKTRRPSCRYLAQISSVISPSPHRVEPRCPYVGLCGGCVWQHVSYDQQLVEKQKKVEALFSPLCPHVSVSPILASHQSWHYRNKMEFSFSQAKDGKRFLGLYGMGSRRVVDIASCAIAPQWMSEALAEVRRWWAFTQLSAYHQSRDEGTLLTVTFREAPSTQDRMVILTVSGVPAFAPKREHLDTFVECIRRSATSEKGDLSVVLRIRQIAKGRPTQLYEMILFGQDHMREQITIFTAETQKKLEFHISPQTFFQPNTLQSTRIYSHALTAANLLAEDRVADLYCGLGIFGMFSALLCASSFGIELSRDAAYDAKVNAQRLGMANFTIHCGDVAQLSLEQKERPSVVIVDPPRSGLLSNGIAAVCFLNPARIVYVSCQPKTQASDVKTFQERGWCVQSIQPIDQFPHTTHVENIVLLQKSS